GDQREESRALCAARLVSCRAISYGQQRPGYTTSSPCRGQRALDRRTSSPPCVLQWRDAVLIRRPEIGTLLPHSASALCFGHRLHNLLMSTLALTEENRLQQGRPAQPIDAIDLQVAVRQRRLGDLHMAPFRCWNERDAPKAVGESGIGPRTNRRLDDVEES